MNNNKILPQLLSKAIILKYDKNQSNRSINLLAADKDHMNRQ